jgi:hypothetical protein
VRYAVCPRCEGRGSHVNPAVDGNGITAEEMDELGEDFREDYLSGVYDVRCEECGGNRVVPACRCGKPVAEGRYFPYDDEDGGVYRPYSACYDHLRNDEREWLESERDTAAMYAAELRVGA